MKIKIKNNGMYALPKRSHVNDCGADVYSPIDIAIRPHETVKIDLGFAIDVPVGYGGFIFPRSGLSSKGLVCELPPIDPLYSGNLHAIVHNGSNNEIHVEKGDRVGQLVIIPVIVAEFVDTLDKESRGSDAFGSTGLK